MALQSRQFAKIKENDILNISLHLATSQDIKEWSHGEITSPETINYKTYKPERGGLFDEVIFGPQTDYKCPICGTKYKRSNEGQICEKTDECKLYQPEILPAISRRTRMAHIDLASPVVHFWYFKIDNSIIAKLLGLRTLRSSKVHSKSTIEDIIYFKSHIVLEDGGVKSLPKNEVIEINKAAVIYRNALVEIRDRYEAGSEAHQDITRAIEELEATATSKIGKDYGVDFYELNEIIEEYSEARISTGAKAIEYLLAHLDVKAEIRRVKAQISKISRELTTNRSGQSAAEISKRYKRLEVLNAFNSSNQDPRSLLISSLPVIPADLRPLIQIDGGRHSTADINELYRRIIIRNNRLKKWIELDAPVLIIQNEQRMLQEAVDALIDNARKKTTPVLSKDNRPLKSIADALAGKKGRFRQNLLGKRVDYSGRSVIVVGPELKMHQAGIPRQMAAKLFEPWIIRGLLNSRVAISIKAAKKLIEEQDNTIWPFVEEAIKNKVVLLNRAPTLHRLSIQAFEPVLVRGKAIRLHPLVTTAFNADFDGDQMAVHVPISPEAIREAKALMFANKNILGPKDGDPIINPSQDMILGLFYLTKEKAGAQGEGRYFNTFSDLEKAYEQQSVSLHARVAMPTSATNKEYLAARRGYVVTTVGKFILNNAFPRTFPFIFDASEASLKPTYYKFIVNSAEELPSFIANLEINRPLTKKDVARIVRKVFDQYVAMATIEDVAKILSDLHQGNANDTVMRYAEIADFDGNPLPPVHCQILSQITRDSFNLAHRRILLTNQNVSRALEVNERAELLEDVWFKYTNVVAQVLDNIKELGFRYSMLSGATMSVGDIKRVAKKSATTFVAAEAYTSDLKKAAARGLLTDSERYQRVIQKWSEVKSDVEREIKKAITEDGDNPLAMIMESGARGSISNFVQLVGMRGLMANNTNEQATKSRISNIDARLVSEDFRPVVEVPVKSSFLEGLTSYEFYSSTHGARKGLTDTALNTANAGYLTRRLVDVAQNIVVKEEDCGSLLGFKAKAIVDTKTGQTIVPLEERIEGRFAAEDIYGKKGNLIVKTNELITSDMAQEIVRENKIDLVSIRSLFHCQTRNGVCKRCYGKDLSSNRVVQIGEAVGIVAAQSIGEPGTQLTMRTFHTGGVASVVGDGYDRGGFLRLIQLVDATTAWEKKAEISKTKGRVIAIDRDDTATGEPIVVVKVESSNESKEIRHYTFRANRRIRVKIGQDVVPGQKIVDGPIQLDELLLLAGANAVQLYLLKEIQRLYRLQGINISDKYVEIIVHQMLSKIQIKDPGQSNFFAGSLVDIHTYQAENRKLLAKNKIPAYGTLVIRGAKKIPLLSESFLAAASYQETAKVLVHATIAGQVDHLEGLKENIILGHKIPSGTGTSFEARGKYDVRDPREYFKAALPTEN